MINQIRKKIIWHYTLIFATILISVFITTFAVYRHTTVKSAKAGLLNYLNEEIWEAQNEINVDNGEIKNHQFMSDVKTFHYFTYWFLDGDLVRTETPNDMNISEQLAQRLAAKGYKDEYVYHENVKHNKVKWYFLIISKTIQLSNNHTIKVFAVANYTPLRHNLQHYLRIGLTLLIVLVLLSYIISLFFVSKPMKYIENIYQKQKRFVSDAAHELRTPLSILYSYAELLEYKKDKETVIADIKEEIGQMNELIDRLLIFARYDNATSKKNVEQVNLNVLLKSLVSAMSGLTPPNTFQLSVPDKDIFIHADKAMLRQLISIMLDNAIKYTGDNKKIKIDVKILSKEVSISIRDNGIGINEKDIPYLFDRFWRAEESRHPKGLGLGLSLADVIVKMHNGEIKVKSKPAEGTTFEIVLPRKYIHHKHGTQQSNEESNNEKTGS